MRATTRSTSRQLTSAHRIVFRSNGGNDTIVGTLREQDVIELEPGRTAGRVRVGRRTRTALPASTSGTHKMTFTVRGGTQADPLRDPVPTEPEDADAIPVTTPDGT